MPVYKKYILDNFEMYPENTNILTSYLSAMWKNLTTGESFIAKTFENSKQGYLTLTAGGKGIYVFLNEGGIIINHELIARAKQVSPIPIILSAKFTFATLPTGGILYIFLCRHYDGTFPLLVDQHIHVWVNQSGSLYVKDNNTDTLIVSNLFADYKQHLIEVIIAEANQFYLRVDGKRYTKTGGVYFTNYLNKSISDFDYMDQVIVGQSGVGLTDVKVYIDDLCQQLPNPGLQIQNWEHVMDFPAGIAGPSIRRPPFQQHKQFINEDAGPTDKIIKRYVYIPTNDGKIYRFNEFVPETWIEVFTTGGVTYDDYVGFHDFRYAGLSTSGFEGNHVNYWYYHVRHDTTNNKDIIFWSNNNGNTYTVVDTPTANAQLRIIGIRGNDSNVVTDALHVWMLYSAVSPYNVFTEIRYYTLSTTNTWTLVTTFNLVTTFGKNITMTAPNPPPAIASSPRIPNTYTKPILAFVTFTGDTFTSVLNITTAPATLVYSFPAGEALPVPIHANNPQRLIDQTTDNQFIYLSIYTGTAYKLYKSDTGNLTTWTLVNQLPMVFGGSKRFTTASGRNPPYQRFFQIDANTLVNPDACWYCTTKSRLPLFYLPDIQSGEPAGVTASGYCVTTGSQVFWYRPTPDPDIIKVASIIKTQIKQTYCHLVVNPTDAPLLLFSVEKWLEIYDGRDTLVFFGKALNPEETRTSRSFEFDLVTHDYELDTKVFRDAKGESMALIMRNLIAQLSFLYDEGNWSLGSGTTVYRKVNDPFQSYCNLIRQQTNGIVIIQPTGYMAGSTYTNTIILKGIYNHDHPDIKLLEYKYISIGITRSEVSGGHNQAGQVRRVYIGANEDNGIFAITMNDPKIMNDAECLELATNRFTMYGGYKWFIKIRVKNQGYLGLGNRIYFQWFDPEQNINIPFKSYLIVDWEPYDVRNDVNDIWITDSVTTLSDLLAVKKSIKRDDVLTGTYFDSSVQSTTNSVPVIQNTVSRLTSGTYIWRIPEPVAWDFTITTVPSPGSAGWRLFNLASILPDGVRAIHMRVEFQDTPFGTYFLMRKPGGTGSFQCTGGYQSSNNTYYQVDLVCGVSENKQLDVFFSAAPNTWIYWYFIILGWWI